MSVKMRCWQKRASYFLEQLSSGMTLTLAASRSAGGAKGKEGAAVERITKTVHVRFPFKAHDPSPPPPLPQTPNCEP
jgi:hypothetical protein